MNSILILIKYCLLFRIVFQFVWGEIIYVVFLVYRHFARSLRQQALKQNLLALILPAEEGLCLYYLLNYRLPKHNEISRHLNDFYSVRLCQTYCNVVTISVVKIRPLVSFNS